MTAALFKTPADLTITPRDRRFGRDQAQNRWWAGGDPIATAFYNALSVTFPKGEAMFIEAVKAHRDGVPPKLDAEIKAFVIRGEKPAAKFGFAFDNFDPGIPSCD